jgi:hypothetical protein
VIAIIKLRNIAIGYLRDREFITVHSVDLWDYLSDAPIAVAIIIGLLAAFVGFLVAAIRTKPEKR